MNNQNKQQEPAFPYAFQFENEGGVSLGMSLRDYFAAKALTGIMADQNMIAPNGEIAIACYAIADAMMEARKQ